jgi:hypothetical protein
VGSTHMRIWSRCWAPPEMGLCGVSLIWCGRCLGAPAVRFTRLLCAWPANESAPPFFGKTAADNVQNMYMVTEPIWEVAL